MYDQPPPERDVETIIIVPMPMPPEPEPLDSWRSFSRTGVCLVVAIDLITGILLLMGLPADGWYIGVMLLCSAAVLGYYAITSP